MIDARKRVVRRVASAVREAGKVRRLVITIYPNGILGLRPERTRREELIDAAAAWRYAVRCRVAVERMNRPKARRGRRR